MTNLTKLEGIYYKYCQHRITVLFKGKNKMIYSESNMSENKLMEIQIDGLCHPKN